MPVELVEQPPRTATRCPDCGGEPTPDVEHTLSALGYAHDDQRHVCSECGRTWTCGVPIGEFDGGADLRCPDSDCEEWGRVVDAHAESIDVSAMRFDHKCGDEDCRYFAQASEITIPCESCECREMWTHRVRTASNTTLTLTLACSRGDHEPTPTWVVERRTDGNGIALVGNPAITGDVAGADPYGYQTAPGPSETDQGVGTKEASE